MPKKEATPIVGSDQPEIEYDKTLDAVAERELSYGDAAEAVFSMLDDEGDLVAPPRETPSADSDVQADGEDEAEVTEEDVERAEEAVDETDEETEEESDLEDEEETEEDEEGTEAAGEELHTVKVAGEEVEVTLDELYRGYSRQQDYTRKTQELARERQELRSTVEQEQAEARAKRDEYGSALERMHEALKRVEEQEPDWAKLEREEPERYAIEYAKWQRYKDNLARVQAEKDKISQQQQEESEHQYREYLEREKGALIEAVPEWQDEKVKREGIDSLADYARTTYGYSDQDLNNVTDHRLMLILRKAQMWDDLQTKGRDQVEGKKKKAKVLKPGQPKGRKPAARKAAEARRRRLESSGDVKDAASVIESLLDD